MGPVYLGIAYANGQIAYKWRKLYLTSGKTGLTSVMSVEVEVAVAERRPPGTPMLAETKADRTDDRGVDTLIDGGVSCLCPCPCRLWRTSSSSRLCPRP